MDTDDTVHDCLEEEMDDEESIQSKPQLNNPEDFVAYLNDAHKDGSISGCHFREWWKRKIPKLFSPFPTMDYLDPLSYIDDEAVQKEILDPMEMFLCGGNPAEIMNSLSNLKQPSNVCGKLFKHGEPTYSCKDCCHDATCVLCVECFKQSEHRHHRYKMLVSSGGGYCDCGDEEAWDRDVHCAIHALKDISEDEEKEPVLTMPEDIQIRSNVVFKHCIMYIYEMLTLELLMRLPTSVRYTEEDTSMDEIEPEELYCTVIYNDEIHTYEDVIATLPRAVDCDKDSASSLVTLIDREGRAVVKCSTYQNCNEVKKIADRLSSRRGGKPMKVVIMHTHVVAHQHFAIRLINWIHKYMDFSSEFRTIFSNILFIPNGKRTFVEKFFRSDVILWKSARSAIHHLIITGMLMTKESKKKFSCLFARNYGEMMKEFIRDDQDHSYSISSISVQIFTVPTLAHHLIGNQDILAIIFNTLNSEMEGQINSQGKLEFQRESSINIYRSYYYICFDLKYLLTTPPTEWTDNLRKGFLHGVSLLLKFLFSLQGMDQQIRHVNHHIVYEKEWEVAFNLHLRIAPIVNLICKWCSTDKEIFKKVMNMLLKKIISAKSKDDQFISKTLCNKTAECLNYFVSSQHISLHLPLNRMLAGLCLNMEKFDMDATTYPFEPLANAINVQQIMEPALQTLVLASQVQAGMWRRNGHAIVDQIRAYHSASLRNEMYDKDIVLMQLAAAHMDSDEYIINLLNKFELFNWAEPEFECSDKDSIRQFTSLVEEFLGNLIVILGERHVPGVGCVTFEDFLRKEIIQQLCISSMTHSALNRYLPEYSNKETGIEKIIQSVATFSKPTSQSKTGLYNLKEEFYKDYNVFFYHYTREQQSNAEGCQLNRRKEAKLPQCNPPPLPPAFTKQFEGVIKIMECDVFLHLLSLLVERADNLKTRCFSECQIHKTIHLIGLCLLEEERERKIKFTEKSKKFNLLGQLENLVGNQRILSHKDLLTWTIQKWKKVANIGESSSSPDLTAKTEEEEKKKKAEMAAARRAKIMAQMKSAQNSFIKGNYQLFSDSQSFPKKRQRPESVSEAVKSEPMMVEESSSSSNHQVCLGGSEKSPPVEEESTFTCILCQEEESLTFDGEPLVLTAHVQKSVVLSRQQKGLNPSSMVFTEDDQESMNINDQSRQYQDFPILTADMSCSLYTSSCGHIMHFKCWEKFYYDILASENSRTSRSRNPNIFDTKRNEFLCPLCRCICNSVVPLVPQFNNLHEQRESNSLDFSDWLQALMIALKYKKELSEPESNEENPTESNECQPGTSQNFSVMSTLMESNLGKSLGLSKKGKTKSKQLPMRKRYYTCPLDQVSYELTEQKINSEHFIKAFAEMDHSKFQISESVLKMMNHFSNMVFQVTLDKTPEEEDERVPLLVWQACAYTIHSITRSIMDEGKNVFMPLSLRKNSCLFSLIRLCGLLGTKFGDSDVIRSHSLKLLSTILEVDTFNLCVLEVDAFGLLVSLTFSMPSLFNTSKTASLPLSNEQDKNILHLIFLMHLVQIILTTDKFSLVDTMEDTENIQENCEPIMNLFRVVRESVGFASDNDGSESLNPSTVWNNLKIVSLPFLRCCALFYHYLSNVPLPQVSEMELIENEFSILMKYMGLPDNPSELCKPPIIEKLARKWSNHPNVLIMLSSATQTTPISYLIRSNGLANLPEDYSELINMASNFTCPKFVKDESPVPSLCLICNQILCSQGYCCRTTLDGEQVGACTAHSEKCGAGNGIFLRLKDCTVFLLSGKNSRKKGCFIGSPYLDEYGEEDFGLKRGNPLKLCSKRLQSIHNMWLYHKIPEVIAHTLEGKHSYYSPPQWSYL